MSIRIQINGQTVMQDADGITYKSLREGLAIVAKTANIDAKGPQSVVAKLAKTGSNFVSKPDTDTIEIFETPETKGATESLLAKYRVKNLGQRILDALQAQNRKPEFVAKSETEKSETVNGTAAEEFAY